MSLPPVKRLLCSCCGAATRGRQWHNLDTGWGLCTNCVYYCKQRTPAGEFQRVYGQQGVHYDVGEQK